MAAAANGLSLFGGLRPLVGTFLVFADYLKPAFRLSAIQMQPVTYVLTHDIYRTRARTAPRTSRSTSWPCCAPCRERTSSGPPTPTKPLLAWQMALEYGKAQPP